MPKRIWTCLECGQYNGHFAGCPNAEPEPDPMPLADAHDLVRKIGTPDPGTLEDAACTLQDEVWRLTNVLAEIRHAGTAEWARCRAERALENT